MKTLLGVDIGYNLLSDVGLEHGQCFYDSLCFGMTVSIAISKMDDACRHGILTPQKREIAYKVHIL